MTVGIRVYRIMSNVASKYGSDNELSKLDRVIYNEAIKGVIYFEILKKLNFLILSKVYIAKNT